jgi:GNAT superfamily N-acetyltransferase
MNVRRANGHDVDRIAVVYNAAARAGWEHFIPGVREMDVSADAFASRFEAGGTETFVAVIDGEVVAFAHVVTPSTEPIANAGELDMLYAHPKVWGQGVGRALLATSVDRLRAVGCSIGVLWTAEANDRPRRIYETAGWRPDGIRRTRVWRGTVFEELRYLLDLGVSDTEVSDTIVVP